MYTSEQIQKLQLGEKVGLLWGTPRFGGGALGSVVKITKTQVVVQRQDADRRLRFMLRTGHDVGDYGTRLCSVEDAKAAIAERARRDAAFTMVTQLEKIRWAKESFEFLQAVTAAVAAARDADRRADEIEQVKNAAAAAREVWAQDTKLDGEKPEYEVKP